MRALILLLALLISFPAQAANQCGSIQRTIASTVWDFDVTCGNSYNGGGMGASGGGGEGQFWLNLANTFDDLTDNPGTDAIFILGLTPLQSSTDPTFTGSPGSSSAYFSFDGGDYLLWSIGPTFSPVTFMQMAHQESSEKLTSVIVAFYYKDSGAAQGLFGNSAAAATAGFNVYITAGDGLAMLRYSGDGNSQNTTLIADGTLVDGTWYTLGWTLDSDSRTWKAGLNSDTFTASGTATAVTNNTISTEGFFTVGAAGGSSIVPSGSRVAAISAYTEILSNAQLASARDFYQARHGRAY